MIHWAEDCPAGIGLKTKLELVIILKSKKTYAEIGKCEKGA